ncbi:hypothetical protein KORDIASMS9_02661 [Kordia sp. SMS9]|uniref:hypothetical protein n=1 Tax=Kordia sp. SMS9 TaxID=2282170 RepID=UPI000E0DDD07|nr:hypothetical protein [Kordia sp. SMS9]AXG70421.1 hypothetical protein KORDIASMS9_02661 [Kordia sp. SMS9]
MLLANFTKPGGLPFEQNTLAFMQFAYLEIINSFISHLTSDNQNYIISGCAVENGQISSGWMVINKELLFFEQTEGDLSSKIAPNSELFDQVFQDGVTHQIYTIQTAIIDDLGVELNDFITIPNAMEFLTSVPSATESVSGIAEIATQAEADQGVNDLKIITPKKLAESLPVLSPPPPQATESVSGIARIATQNESNGSTVDDKFITPKKLNGRSATTTRTGVVELATTNEAIAGVDTQRAITPKALADALASLIPQSPILHTGTYTIGNPGLDQLYTVNFPNVQTSNYMIAGSIVSVGADWNTDNDVFYVVRNKTSSSFQLAIREIESVVQNIRFEYMLVRF